MKTSSYRTTARVIGVLFLVAFLAYGGGSGLVASVVDAPDYLSSLAASETQLRFGAVLMLINSLVIGALGVLMLQVARPHGEGVAFGYLAARITEAVVLAVGVVFLLLQIPLGREYQEAGAAAASSIQILSDLSMQGDSAAYQIAMIALGVGSVPFWYLFYRVGLVPRILAAWGIVGYAVFASGAVLELLGLEVGLILSIPGGLFEVALAIWLIARGFSSPVNASRATPAETSIAVAA